MSGFGDRLKEARGAESQASFAMKLGVSQVAYSRYESGQREPSLECLYHIGIITGVSVDWLLGLPERGGGNIIGKNTGAVAIGSNARTTVNGRANIPRGEAELAKRGASGVTPTAPPPPDCKNCKYKRLADAFKAL